MRRDGVGIRRTLRQHAVNQATQEGRLDVTHVHHLVIVEGAELALTLGIQHGDEGAVFRRYAATGDEACHLAKLAGSVSRVLEVDVAARRQAVKGGNVISE